MEGERSDASVTRTQPSFLEVGKTALWELLSPFFLSSGWRLEFAFQKDPLFTMGGPTLVRPFN